jgi:hypothetical protein
VETHRAPLAAWQEEVLATANLVKSERDWLLSRDRGNDDATCPSYPPPMCP